MMGKTAAGGVRGGLVIVEKLLIPSFARRAERLPAASGMAMAVIRFFQFSLMVKLPFDRNSYKTYAAGNRNIT